LLNKFIVKVFVSTDFIRGQVIFHALQPFVTAWKKIPILLTNFFH